MDRTTTNIILQIFVAIWVLLSLIGLVLILISDIFLQDKLSLLISLLISLLCSLWLSRYIWNYRKGKG